VEQGRNAIRIKNDNLKGKPIALNEGEHVAADRGDRSRPNRARYGRGRRGIGA